MFGAGIRFAQPSLGREFTSKRSVLFTVAEDVISGSTGCIAVSATTCNRILPSSFK